MDAATRAHYLADDPPSVVRLEIKPHFETLTDKQKRYAHWISRAAWHGTRVTLRQVSPESEPIYDFILALDRRAHEVGGWKSLAIRTGVPSAEFDGVLNYFAQFLGNGGNYKGFGDSKFIPRASEATFRALCTESEECEKALELALNTGTGIFEAKATEPMHLGYPAAGHASAYYPDSPDISKDEIQAIGDLCEAKKLQLENTRLSKKGDIYELLIAGGEETPATEDQDLQGVYEFELEGALKGKKLKLVYGDYLNEMRQIAFAMKQAIPEAENENQAKMLEAYHKSFRTGSLKAFRDSQVAWIQDKGPAVETNIGFIESYRDPHGVRAEWEGLVSMVNKERTRAFSTFVTRAQEFIPTLPWSKDFEKDKFQSPDFTSLEVLTFAGSGPPAGINLPNDDSIRQTLGFKNVSLGNVLNAKASNEKIPFVPDCDLAMFQKYRDPAFEVQVGCHELLGHGTGKLLQETEPGKYNFDLSNPPLNPLTNSPVKSWYKPGQTWNSVFGSYASSMEECRAECVAMALCCNPAILSIFGFGDGSDAALDGEAGDVLFTAYLTMARAGVMALEFWDPKSRKWGQAHMQARFSILKTFLSAGDDFVKLHYTEEDLSDLVILLDRSKILSHGKPAVDKYLTELHVRKSTADFEGGKKLYDEMTNVDEWWGGKVRPAVLAKKQPRKVYVQANTILDRASGKVSLKEYEASAEGMIRSFVERDV